MSGYSVFNVFFVNFNVRRFIVSAFSYFFYLIKSTLGYLYLLAYRDISSLTYFSLILTSVGLLFRSFRTFPNYLTSTLDYLYLLACRDALSLTPFPLALTSVVLSFRLFRTFLKNFRSTLLKINNYRSFNRYNNYFRIFLITLFTSVPFFYK